MSGNTILITGGAAGIGLALAERFIGLGNRVVAVGRDERKLEELQRKHPNAVAVYACDVGRRDQLDRLIVRLKTEQPGLNVLINNAGIQFNYSVADAPYPDERVTEEIAVNLTAPLLLTSGLLPLLIRQPEAAVVNVSSGLGLVPKKSAPVYCATKAAIHLYSIALRYQLEDTSVRVFEIIPPVVDTEMTRGRGRNKISPERLVDEFLRAFGQDKLEVPIGKTKLLMALQRLAPSIAANILKNG